MKIEIIAENKQDRQYLAMMNGLRQESEKDKLPELKKIGYKGVTDMNLILRWKEAAGAVIKDDWKSFGNGVDFLIGKTRISLLHFEELYKRAVQ